MSYYTKVLGIYSKVLKWENLYLTYSVENVITLFLTTECFTLMHFLKKFWDAMIP